MLISNDGINTQGLLARHAKIERRDIYRYGDTEVVGIDCRQIGLLLCIADGFGASHQNARGKQ